MVAKNRSKQATAHTDDITALALSPRRDWVATGQVGLAPLIFIWSSDAAKTRYPGPIKLPKGARAVTALGFNDKGTRLAATDLSNEHVVYIYDLNPKRPELVYSK